MTDRRVTGSRAEDLAVARLISDGFEILARNWSCRVGELDVIAARGELVLFVEVRSVRHGILRTPELSVDMKKQKRVSRAAEIWLSRFGSKFHDIRFDVVAVQFMSDGGTAINYIDDAFVPPWSI